jgi:hypothetical protein
LNAEYNKGEVFENFVVEVNMWSEDCLFAANVKSGKRELIESIGRFGPLINVDPGQDFEIEIINQSGNPVLAEILIDGQQVINQEDPIIGSSGFVVEPGCRKVFSRWLLSKYLSRPFKFGVPTSGKQTATGEIKVNFYPPRRSNVFSSLAPSNLALFSRVKGAERGWGVRLSEEWVRGEFV